MTKQTLLVAIKSKIESMDREQLVSELLDRTFEGLDLQQKLYEANETINQQSEDLNIFRKVLHGYTVGEGSKG